jgi:hypothetical protein
MVGIIDKHILVRHRSFRNMIEGINDQVGIRRMGNRPVARTSGTFGEHLANFPSLVS